MKIRIVSGFVLAALILLVCGCAAERPFGIIYTDARSDIQGLNGELNGLQCGKSVAVSYFGLVAVGDCSIDTAVKNGGIDEIRYVDRNCSSVLGYTEITTCVYGTIKKKQEKEKKSENETKKQSL